MKIAIIGAGPSGLATAAVLQQVGHDVVVFEKAPDIGGVWSATRAYPGVCTQDDRVTYAFSDVPMPDDFPEHPSGAEVRAYLEGYARTKGLQHRIQLSTLVESAEPRADGDGWVVRVVGEQGPACYEVDWLVVANGVFSTPHVPRWPGREEFEAHGGRVVTPTGMGGGADLDGRRVVVVGWGKTACDVAVASSWTAATTTVVARRILWKIPQQLAGGLTFRHLLLTRLGEHVMHPRRSSSGARVVAALGMPVRRAVTGLLGRSIARRTGLHEVGMVPSAPLPHSDSLVTDQFFEALAQGRIDVRRERWVEALGAVDGAACLRLSDGTWLRADVVLAATGFDQELPFFSPSVRAALQGADGVLALHRRILPLDVPRLSFAGWGHTYRSPLTAELGAVWLAGHLAGVLRTPPEDEVRRTADRYHLTHRQAAERGEQQLPTGSFEALDVLLDDLGLPLPTSTRLRQWVVPLEPADYAHLLPSLQQRLRRLGGAGHVQQGRPRGSARVG